MRYKAKMTLDAIRWLPDDSNREEVLSFSSSRHELSVSLMTYKTIIVTTPYGLARAHPGDVFVRCSCGAVRHYTYQEFTDRYEIHA